MTESSARGDVKLYPANPANVERLVRSMATNSKNIRWSTHALKRMDEREILDVDVLRVLRTGTLAGKPEVTERGEWKCKLTRNIRGSRDVGVVTIILKESKLLVKTAEWEDLR